MNAESKFNLAERAMTVTLRISSWTGRKYDRKISDKVNTQEKAENDAGRYNKRLFPKDVFKDINRIKSEARAEFYRLTLPWLDEGTRLLPASASNELDSILSKKKKEMLQIAVPAFIRDYPKHLAAAPKRLGKMYVESDFPTVEELKTLFDFDYLILPCPDANDFRVEMSDAQKRAIQEDIEDRVKAQLQTSMRDVAERVVETIGHVSKRLKGYKPSTKKGEKTENTFRDTLISNVEDLAKLIPALNVTNDRRLADLASEMETKICKHKPDALREDSSLRSKVAKDADAILQNAKAFLG